MLISGPLLLAKNFEKRQIAYRTCSRLTGADGSTGVWKAVQKLEIPLQNAIACLPLPRVRLPIQNLMLKLFLSSCLEASYKIYEN